MTVLKARRQGKREDIDGGFVMGISRSERQGTGMEIYNSLGKAVEPLNLERNVGLYVCGITPYDATHLGHAFTYITFDVLIRLLRFMGHEVTYVQNVTDVDDDILARAASQGVDWRELGEREVEKFLRDCDALNNLRPAVMPKATEHIQGVLEMAQALLQRGVAYEREGNVYFSMAEAPSFASRLLTAGYEDALSIANERGNFPDDPLKRDPLDFVLWQRSKPGEPSWESPWGAGRPGWHIECSALSREYLGVPFAIHGGGSDLLFPHHECEIAQGEYAEGVIPARYWMHVGMLRYEGEKMSKSLGNMVFVADLLQTYTSDAIRYLLLSHHYRSAWEYQSLDMEEAQARVGALTERLKDVGTAPREEMELLGQGFLASMSRDLDTPSALSELSRLAEDESVAARQVARSLAMEVLGFRLSA